MMLTHKHTKANSKHPVRDSQVSGKASLKTWVFNLFLKEAMNFCDLTASGNLNHIGDMASVNTG